VPSENTAGSRPEAPPSLRRHWLIPALLIVCVGLFFLLTLRPGHRWGDDFAMYLLHAHNIAEGLPYSTGYVYNPAEPHTGPPAYPPVYALLLVPVYKIAGLNYSLLKAVDILAFLIFLWALFVLSALYLAWPWRIALLAVVGFQPYLWNLKDDIVSEWAFLMFLYVALALAESLYARPKPLGAAFLLGGTLYLVYGTRTVGLAIIPAILLYDIVRRRRLTLFTCVAATFAVALAFLQGKLLRTTGGYGGLFDLSPSWLIHNSILYIKSVRVFLVNGYSNLLSYAIFAVALALAAWGAWHQLRRGVHLLEMFALVYLPLIVAFRVPGAHRYLLPVLPLFFIYVLAGLQAVLERTPSALRTLTAAAALFLIVFTYAGAYAKSDWGPIREGVNDPDFLAACQYLQQHAAPSDIVIFRKPRLLALLTGRQSAIYTTTGDPKVIRAFVHTIHARYIVLASVSHEDFSSDADHLAPFIQRYRDLLTEVYSNPHYRIFATPSDF
jgi:hypothetical protein